MDPSPAQSRSWGGSRAIARHLGLVPWADLLVGFAVAGALLAALHVAKEFGKSRLQGDQAVIHLELPYLGLYTLYSLARGSLAYLLSLVFAISYGYWAAKDRAAEKVLLPILDILQSIPVVTFMPGFMLSLAFLIPHSDLGLNLASILMIFTGQAWNMVFSFYHSVKTIPPDLYEAGQIYRFGWWRRFSRIELPSTTVGLVWNSMMSMAGGWFFLMLSETFELGEHNFRLPGLGTYMTVAQDQGDYRAVICAVLAMGLMIVAMNQLVWRPAAVWAQRFRIEDVAAVHTEESWLMDLLRRSRLLWLGHRILVAPLVGLLDAWDTTLTPRPARVANASSPWSMVPRLALWVALLFLAGWGIYLLVVYLLLQVHLVQWAILVQALAVTLARVLATVVLGTLLMVPIGVSIGLRPRLAARLQPAIQVAASFPAPLLFGLFLLAFDLLGIDLSWGSILLMLAGTQWYILFNVLGGAMAIPSDLHEATSIYRWSRAQRWRHLYLPAVFPFLVTGWVTAAGGAWNTSIVAEYWKVAAPITETRTEDPERAETVPRHTPISTGAESQPWERELFGGSPDDPRIRRCFGLGAIITRATQEENYRLLAAGTLLMAFTVVMINRLVWRRMALVAERRFSLSR
jgi:NitT/TauT family transport system permease protein